MRKQIVSEWRKLTTTRSAFAMLVGLLAIVALGTVAAVTDHALGHAAVPLQSQPFLHVAMTIVPLFALLLGIRSFTDEFRFGSIVPTLLVDPDRRRVLGAKIVVGAIGGLVMAGGALALSAAIGIPVLASHGIEITASVPALAEVVARVLGAAVLWTTIGVGVGLAVRHQVAAIAGALVWMIAGEGILGGLLPSVSRFFPGAASMSMSGIVAADVLRPALAAAVLAGYAIVATAAGQALMRRRDVT